VWKSAALSAFITSRYLAVTHEPFKPPKVEREADPGGSMGEKRDRDVEKVYSTSEFVAKLRRLADALEAGERFEIQVAGERVYVPARAGFNVEHERRGTKRRSSFSSSGPTREFLNTGAEERAKLVVCYCPTFSPRWPRTSCASSFEATVGLRPRKERRAVPRSARREIPS
jgi:amphi-Trp domain-containing protein